MKKIIAVDFYGTLIKNEPAEKAHYEWFNIMASALHDNSIKKYAGTKDYFKYVYKVMARYTGLNQKKEEDAQTMRKFARNLFQMSCVALANRYKNRILVKEFASLLEKLKKDYSLALITTSPEDSVLPILKIIKKDSLFDIIYKSPLKKEPKKEELFKAFIKKYGKPLCYVGNSDEDMLACKRFGILSILATWDKVDGTETAKKIAVYTASSSKQIEEIIKTLK